MGIPPIVQISYFASPFLGPNSLCESHKSWTGRQAGTTDPHIGTVLNHNSIIIKQPGATNKEEGEFVAVLTRLDSVINFVFPEQM